MRLIFMGTPDFALPSLHVLCESGHDICAIYTQPPRGAGRGMGVRVSKVQAAIEAEGRDLKILTPPDFKASKTQDEFDAHQADLAIVIAYGQILPPRILGAPRLGCWNLHASLLPRWRGAAPIQHAILAGDKKTGISLMQMEAGLDTGAVILQRACAIDAGDTGGDLHDRLAVLSARLLGDALVHIEAGDLPSPTRQDEARACYASKLTSSMGRLDWRDDAVTLARQVRAFAPTPGAWSMIDGARIKILAAKPHERDDSAQAGMVVDATPMIACGRSALELITLQRAGGKPMSAQAFQRGAHRLRLGQFLKGHE